MFMDAWMVAGLVTLVFVTAIWVLSLVLRDSSIVDIFWGFGFITITWTLVASGVGELTSRAWLMAALVTVWGLRLSLHILRRNRGKGEDFRYRAWREQAGHAWWWRSYFKVFLLQGAVMWLVAAPVVAVLSRSQHEAFNWIDGIAIAAWAIGFFFEAAGDWQLARFKSDPASKGRVMSGGVWRYTRHPNYFGDATVWWGHYLVAAAAGAWWTVFSPILMTFLLVRVSGVSMLESALRESKPGYREYIQSTSAFFPLPPRRRD
jgi:steroid 5-alpha reductase family enzyme